MKLNLNLHLEPMSDELITQPNQAFSPRQILEQFARGEIIPSENKPTDNIYVQEGITEDDFDSVIEFEDPIDAEQHLKMNQYSLFQDEEEPKDQGNHVQESTEVSE